MTGCIRLLRISPQGRSQGADTNHVQDLLPPLSLAERRARPEPTVALVHDYLTQRGGAERVVLAMMKAFPRAPLYTSLYDPVRTFPEFDRLDVRPLPLDRVGVLRRRHRLALPLLARAFSRLELDADVVVCSSSGWAHGVHALGRKIVYCHSPARWLYQCDRYLRGSRGPARAAAGALRPYLVRADRRAAASADTYLTVSSAVRDRIRDAYGLDPHVLPPPHALTPAGAARPVEGLEPGFILCVSRLLSYKNVDAVVAAFSALPGQRLVVVGSGPEETRLRQLAGRNVRLLGSVDDAVLRWLYSSCTGVVAASNEDFGLTPIEAAAFAKPVAVLRWGGFLDTLVEGTTGLYFDRPVPAEIARALRSLVARRWSASVLRAHAAGYSEEVFIDRLRAFVLADSASRATVPVTLELAA